MRRDGVRPLTPDERTAILREGIQRGRSAVDLEMLDVFLGESRLSIGGTLLLGAVGEFFYWKGRRDGAALALSTLGEMGGDELSLPSGTQKGKSEGEKQLKNGQQTRVVPGWNAILKYFSNPP